MITPREMADTHAAASTRSRPWSESEFDRLLQMPGCLVTGDARCFALVRLVLDEAELLTIATRPTWQRQGLARATMTTWQDLAQRRGARRAFLEVASDNSAAIALYHGLGYTANGLRPGYYRRENAGKIAALMMARTLC